MFGQAMDGPTTNIILYFGLTADTAQLLAQPSAAQPNALRLLCKFWANFHQDRKLQERLKLIAVCRNFEALGGMVRAFSSYNGKPVLVTRSGTVYRGETPGGIPYGGIDMNLRCWAYLARTALVKCIDVLPRMDMQVAFTIEGDSKKKGGECESELPEQVFASCLCTRDRKSVV